MKQPTPLPRREWSRLSHRVLDEKGMLFTALPSFGSLRSLEQRPQKQNQDTGLEHATSEATTLYHPQPNHTTQDPTQWPMQIWRRRICMHASCTDLPGCRSPRPQAAWSGSRYGVRARSQPYHGSVLYVGTLRCKLSCSSSISIGYSIRRYGVVSDPRTPFIFPLPCRLSCSCSR